MATQKEIIQFTAKGLKQLKKDVKGLEAQLKQLDKAYKRNTKSSKGATKSLGPLIAKLGLSFLAYKAVTGAMSGTIRVGKEFEKEMSNVGAISGATGDQLLRLEKNAKDLGRTTVFTAGNVASLSTEFAKLGFTSEEIINATTATLDLAAVARVELAEAAATTGVTLRAFGLDAKETSRVTDTMALSFSRSALDMQKFSDSMKFVAPVAKAAGFSVEGTTAVLGTLANAGIDGSLAGTALRRIFLELQTESSKLAKRLGGPVRNSEELQEALKRLNAEGVSTAEMKDLVGLRAVSAFKIMLDGVESIDKLTTSLENSGGAAERMAEIQLDNLAGSITKLKSAMEGLGIAIFEHVSEPIRGLIDAITVVTGAMTDWLEIPMSDKMEKDRQKVNALTTAIYSSNQQQGIRKELLLTLIAKYPTHFGHLDAEKSKHEDIAKALKEYNEQSVQKILIARREQDITKLLEEQADAEDKLREAREAAGVLLQSIIGTSIEGQKIIVKEGATLEEQYSQVKKQLEELSSNDFFQGRFNSTINTIYNLEQAFEAIDARSKQYSETIDETSPGIVKLEQNIAKLKKELLELLGIQTEGDEGDGGFDPDPLEKYNTALADHKEKLLIAREAKIAQMAVDIAMKDGLAEITEEILKQAEAQVVLAEATKLSAEQRAAIETEFSERYREAVTGTYALESAEITASMERYSKVEKDKTKLQTVEDELRKKLHIRTAQMVASSFAQSMQTMADAGMVGQKTAKRFAQVQALVDAYASANAAYKAMAGIPVVGPGLAIAAAAAAMAAGLANVQMIEKARSGFEGVVDRPTMFLTGEGNRAEHVSVTPLESENLSGPQPSNTININVSGGVVQEDYVRNELLPAINKELGLGASLA